ncbi:Mth938-like domain-containing protein [Thermithiobacillus plumbiphilus]|uniref:Mth938-like domain-containing protein n=1 Tax=Thermithiobacillus plumbiphilus TaxID=1729899 RepID=A0ABU9DEL8_9PROT
MKLHLQRPGDQNQITSYAPGELRINDNVYQRSLIVAPRWMQADWAPQTFEELQSDSFAEIIQHRPEIVLLGTGRRLRFPAPAVLGQLRATGSGIEVMDTTSACRTYNILMGEDRDIVAALLMIELA